MNKKHNILLCAALLAAGLTLAGCADDDVYSGSGSPTARPGEAIQFGVNKVATRTIYEEYDSTNNVYPIDWTDYDRIFISSTDAYPGASLGGKHNAVYSVVKPKRQDFPYHGEFYAIDPKTNGEVANSDFGLHWGNGEEFDKSYTFYGAYPAQRVKGYPDNMANVDPGANTIDMEYYTNQLCTVDTLVNDRYESTPDMLNAYMVARKTLPTPTSDHILLDFKPAMTTLDIYITAGGYEVATGIIQPVTVTGVSIITPGEVDGDKLTFNTSQLQYEGNNVVTLQNFNPASGSTESVFVGVKNNMVVKVDSGNTAEETIKDTVRYVDLYEGETLHLMAFLPPFRDVADGTKIKVHALGGLNFVFKLKEGHNYFEAQKRIDVQLPDISPVLGDSPQTVNAWISELDENTPLTRMSIPGVDNEVCKKDANGNELSNNKEIANRINELLNLGVRYFNLEDIIFLNRGHAAIPDDISTVFKTFLANNPGEFIIISYEVFNKVIPWTGLPDGLKEDEVPYCEFGGTIADVKGKVVGMREDANYFYPMEGFRVESNRLFKKANISDDENFQLNSNESTIDWQAKLVDDGISSSGLDKICYKILETSEQTQNVGIVRLPSVNPNGDLLIQSVIDCNFKFH